MKVKAKGPRSRKPSRTELTELEQIPNVGPAIATDLRLLGLTCPQDLASRDPYEMYADLCRITGLLHDPCVLDVFLAATRFMSGSPAQPWWKYTAERKRTLKARSEKQAPTSNGE
jgi:hypothetical protein